MLVSKETILSWLVRLILDEIRNGANVQKIAHWLEMVAGPTLRAWKADLFEMLMRKAKSTATELDDEFILFIDNLIEQIISNCNELSKLTK